MRGYRCNRRSRAHGIFALKEFEHCPVCGVDICTECLANHRPVAMRCGESESAAEGSRLLLSSASENNRNYSTASATHETHDTRETAGRGSLTEELEKLTRLKMANQLTEDEFSAAKAQLLNRHAIVASPDRSV